MSRPVLPALLHVVEPCPSRPVLSPVTSGHFDTSGSEQLVQWFQWALHRLTYHELNGVVTRLAAGDARSLGSICSGTDAPVLVYEAFDAALHHHLIDDDNRLMKMEFAFSTELNSKKREFLLDMYEGKIQRLFRDACLLDQATSYDDVSNGNIPIPRVTDVVGGFPCTDVSRLNPAKSAAVATVKDGSLRTGKANG
jgi:hypothetical protein